jgi:hypothetical protein
MAKRLCPGLIPRLVEMICLRRLYDDRWQTAQRRLRHAGSLAAPWWEVEWPRSHKRELTERRCLLEVPAIALHCSNVSNVNALLLAGVDFGRSPILSAATVRIETAEKHCAD